MRTFIICMLLWGGLSWTERSFAQGAAPREGTTVCTFADGQEMSLHYLQQAFNHHDEPAMGKPWMPGGSALTLFTQTPVLLGDSVIPTGAYTVYLIPDKHEWTLIVSRNTKIGNPYDESQDLARFPMEIGTLDQPATQLTLYFAHLAPKQCNIRVDFGKTRAWVDFQEK